MRARSWGPLYLVAGAGAGDFEDLAARVRDALRGGVGVVQLREKGLPADEARRRGERLRDLAADFDARFVVNDDVDLARRLEADGLHLGQDDASPSAARAILGPDVVIGLSTHSATQLRAAAEEATVDLVGIGPVFPTRTKDAGEPIGVEAALAAPRLFTAGPAYAIGGIDADGARALAAGGLRRVAVASAILAAPDAAAAAAALKSILETT